MSHIRCSVLPTNYLPYYAEFTNDWVNGKASSTSVQLSTNFRLTLIVSIQCVEIDLLSVVISLSILILFLYCHTHTWSSSRQFSFFSLIIVSCIFCLITLYLFLSHVGVLIFFLTLVFLFILFISFVHVWFALLIIIVKHTFNSSILYCNVIFSVNLSLRCVKVNCAVYKLTHAFAIVQNWSTMYNLKVMSMGVSVFMSLKKNAWTRCSFKIRQTVFQ